MERQRTSRTRRTEPAEDGRPSVVARPSRWTPVTKAVTAVASLVAASAVAFFGPGVWQGLQDATGGEPLSVQVLDASQFRSDAHALHSGERVIPRPLSEVLAAPREGFDVPGLRITGDSGGVADPRYLRADLETEEVRWVDASGADTGPVTFFVTDQVLDVLAETHAFDSSEEGCDCRWRLRLTYTAAGGEAEELLVGPADGETFRTTAQSRAAVWNVSTGTCEDVPGLPPMCDADPRRPPG